MPCSSEQANQTLYFFKENENMKKTKFSNLLVVATLVVGTLFSSAMPAFAASDDIIDDTRTASVMVNYISILNIGDI